MLQRTNDSSSRGKKQDSVTQFVTSVWDKNVDIPILLKFILSERLTPGLLAILAKSIANTNTDTYWKKYCQYTNTF